MLQSNPVSEEDTSNFEKENDKVVLVNLQPMKKRKQTTPVPKPDQNKRGKFSEILNRSPSPLASVPEENRLARQTLDDLRMRCQNAEDEVRRGKELAARALDDAHSTLKRAARNMARLLIDVAKRERDAARKRMCQEVERLGRYTVVGRMQGRWEGGAEEESLTEGLADLERDKAELEKEKTSFRTLKRQTQISSRIVNEDSALSQSGLAALLEDSNHGTSTTVHPQDEQDYQLHETKEHIALIETVIRKNEQQLAEREIKLHADRILHLKESKTLRAQDTSNFSVFPVVGQDERYQVLNMIGKGGFSEVFKAYDLLTHSFVAVKIHEMKRDMSDDAKEQYVKHTLREYAIHRTLKHPRIVRLYDYFTIDEEAFGTVLEYCEGVDLDTHLKAHGAMSEKEARGVLIQVWSALRYLNMGKKIIHYDLKPGNLMYHKGNVKLTDFGLSKIVESSTSGETVELTSQGAGTYWYLPPECFQERHLNDGGIRISNKVDVWSVGVIFYELLFARKPFGQGMSQDVLLRSGTMLACPALEFPATSKVSKEAKEYIRQLLTVDKHKRPDVWEASNDPYIRKPN